MSLEHAEYSIHGCNDLQESFSFLISSKTCDLKLVLKFKIIISNFCEKIAQRNLKKLNKRFRENSVIILFEDANEGRFEILWKSSKIKHFLILKSDKECLSKDDKQLVKFVAQFLEKCLHSECLGMYWFIKYFKKNNACYNFRYRGERNQYSKTILHST